MAWLLVLGGAAGPMASRLRPLTDEFALPDSEFDRVLDDLGEQIPEVAGGTGTVVLHSDDGFSAPERDAIERTSAQWRQLPHVLGDRAWWMPAWLDRVLPHLDVEGSSLVEVDRSARPRQRELEVAGLS